MNLQKLFLTILSFVLIASSSLYSQEDQKVDTLVGLIINKDGKGIRNVPVSAKGLTEAVQTNRKGIFTITSKGLPDTITIVLPSKAIFQIPVKGMNFLKIMTREKDFTISEAKDEIVNIGYGSVQRSKSFSGDYSISGEMLVETGETNLLKALAGKVPGVMVVNKDDGTATLKIRGSASFEANTDPLYIVDDAVVDDVQTMSIYDVKKVTIMKDGSIYGVRGANGVVLITTK